MRTEKYPQWIFRWIPYAHWWEVSIKYTPTNEISFLKSSQKMVNIAIQRANRKVQLVLDQKYQLQKEYDAGKVPRESFVEQMKELRLEYGRRMVIKMVYEDPRI